MCSTFWPIFLPLQLVLFWAGTIFRLHRTRDPPSPDCISRPAFFTPACTPAIPSLTPHCQHHRRAQAHMIPMPVVCLAAAVQPFKSCLSTFLVTALHITGAGSVKACLLLTKDDTQLDLLLCLLCPRCRSALLLCFTCVLTVIRAECSRAESQGRTNRVIEQGLDEGTATHRMVARAAEWPDAVGSCLLGMPSYHTARQG